MFVVFPVNRISRFWGENFDVSIDVSAYKYERLLLTVLIKVFIIMIHWFKLKWFNKFCPYCKRNES